MQQLTDFNDTARTTWATGDYDAMMRREGLYEVGARLVRRVGVATGEEVLDLACGTGNTAIPAARAGGDVTGLDLTPRLLEVAERRARAAGVAVDWVEGDAQVMPFDDRRFDVVLSTFGCMFAPRHEMVAEEIVRVLRPGGRLGLCAWTPEGAMGDFFRIVAAYLPPAPAFVDPPLAWGEESQLHALFEGTGLALELHRETRDITYDSPQEAVECYTTLFGPLVQARRLTEADGRWPRLRAELLDLFAVHTTAGSPQVTFPGEYLVAIGRAPS